LENPFPKIPSFAVTLMVMKGQRPPRPESINFSPEIPLNDLWPLVEACWAQYPDQRPNASEIEAAILSLQGGDTTDPVTTDGWSFAIAETRVMTARKYACLYCDMALSSLSLLNDHIQVCHMNMSECLITVALGSS
jgi:hypothetical protein